MTGSLNLDNIRLDGNTISSTDTNGDITLDPDGTGNLIVESGGTFNGNVDVNGASILGAPGTFYVGDDGGSVGAFLNQTASLPLRFMTSGSERMRILAGGGLTFNGDTAAANALDDYEEGTWTPVYSLTSGSATMGSEQAGRYVKVGDMVTIWARLSTSSTS